MNTHRRREKPITAYFGSILTHCPISCQWAICILL
nr:MAG TPA: hypothetical protein [Caudoviricetes sp.]